MNYFEYNGVKSSDMGLRIKSKNVYSSPKFDSQFVSVPGRNGDYFPVAVTSLFG